MVQVDSVLLGVQERDKWRHRMEVLERSLREVRERRRRAQLRLRRVRKEIARLRLTTEALLDLSRSPARTEVSGAARSTPPR